MKRTFVCFFWFVGWDCISLGASLCWSKPNLEIHLPFGFIRIGWDWSGGRAINADAIAWRGFGLTRDRT